MNKSALISNDNKSKRALTELFKRFFAAKTQWLKRMRTPCREKAASDGLVSKRRYPRWKDIAVLQDEADIVTQRETCQRINKESIRLPE